MQTVTAINAYAEYKPAAQLLARRFGPTGGMLDAKARGRDDYAQELRLKAIDVAGHFQVRVGFCLPAERRYTYKALWNRARNWRRDQLRRQTLGLVVDAQREDALGVYEIESQIEARQIVRVLISVLGPEDRDILARLVDADGVIPDAWNPEIDGTLRTFQRRVARLRERAKKAVGM